MGVDVKVLNDAPGPHRMMAWKPGEGRVAWGILAVLFTAAFEFCACRD